MQARFEFLLLQLEVYGQLLHMKNGCQTLFGQLCRASSNHLYDGVLCDLVQKRIVVDRVLCLLSFLQELFRLMPNSILESGSGPFDRP